MLLYDIINESELNNIGNSIIYNYILIRILPIILITTIIVIIIILLYKQNKLTKKILEENNIQRQLLEQIEANTGIKKDIN